MNGDSSTQHPTKAAILVQHAVFTLEVRSQAFLMGGNFLFDPLSIRIMYPVKPFLRFVSNFPFLMAQHGLPARREMHDISRQIPVPQPIIGPTSRQGIALLALLQPFLRMLLRQLSTYASHRNCK